MMLAKRGQTAPHETRRVAPFPLESERVVIGKTNAISILLVACVLVAPCAWSDAVAEPDHASEQTVAKPLTLESVEIRGATRTRPAVVRAYLGLTPGAAIDQSDLLAAIERLRESDLFASVEFFTRPGARRGALVLVLDVEERGVAFRLGTGNTDLDGWYLVPAALSLDNLTGRGERAAVQFFVGYRTGGLSAHYRRGTAPGDRTFWGLEARIAGHERVYFRDGVEYGHPLARGSLDLHLGRRLSDSFSLSLGLRTEAVEADSTGYVRMDAPHLDLEHGDEVVFEDLPAGIAAAVGERERAVWRLDLVFDTRSRERRVGTPVSGLWGRLRTRYTRGDEADYPAACWDLRTYRGVGAGVLALRGRAAVVGEDAPFYDRHYLGGLYTLRGVPSQSLSPPRGHAWLWHGALEYRAPLLGSAIRPRVAGVLFVDAGGSGDADASAADPAVSAGWGVRVRLGWLGYLGVDFALPLTDSPVDESFHAHASLGWSF